MRILLVEDDLQAASGIAAVLRSEGCIVDTTDLGQDGLEIGKLYDYDLIVLDLLLPDIDGFEVLRKLRESNVPTPVLVLSGVSDTPDRVKCLNVGADDYLIKPFDREELVSRVQAIVRRSKGHADANITVGRLNLNLNKRIVEIDGKQLHLTCKEYSILELMCMRKGATITKEMFLNHLYGGIDEPELKIVDVFVCKLRKKLTEAMGGESYIETVWGRGYILKDPVISLADQKQRSKAGICSSAEDDATVVFAEKSSKVR
ncbi:MAG: response regulator transcription factor [Holosporales bacterium]|jgi:two-component system cell cycle response regulator CtrA|nr:response regulator transcription factor [Holosporales bacterium]